MYEFAYSLPNMFSFNRVNETMSFNRSAPMGKYRSFNWADFIFVFLITEARMFHVFEISIQKMEI